MKRESTTCPDPEILAAFVAGNLTGAELEMVADHLRECEDCRMVVADAASYERAVTDDMQPPRIRYWWLAAAAAALIGITSVVLWSRREDPGDRRFRTLVASAPRSARYLEPRLTGGFAWAPLKHVQRGENKLDPQQMKLMGVAGEVLEKTAHDTTTGAQHIAGVAHLLAGEPAEASATLEQLTKQKNTNARVWNDLAAARYADALKRDDAHLFATALAAADAALRIDPNLAEARFNRALILERLGLREQAHQAWQDFLRLDPSSDWAREAKQHLAATAALREFKDVLADAYPRLASAGIADDFVRQYPQESRVWGESEILKRWGESTLQARTTDAEMHLRVASSLAAALARRGEHHLQDSIDAIQHATPSDRSHLASAHLHFREAQALLRERRPIAAEPLFRSAAIEFDAAHSPMARRARYFAANAASAQNRRPEAISQLETLIGENNAAYVGHAAELHWQLGLMYGIDGRWGASTHALRSSLAGFQRLGEMNYAMTIRELLAEVQDRLGDRREAWKQRISALRVIGVRDSTTLRSVLHAIARGAALQDDWDTALSFLDLETAPPRKRGDELMYVKGLLTRAAILHRLGEPDRAIAALARATIAMTRVPDARLQQEAEAERLAIHGLLAESPRRAIELLTAAIEFQHLHSREMVLPEMYLQRGRAFLAHGAPEPAANDFDTGIRELEKQRVSIERLTDRWGIYGSADELFDEAAALAIDRRNDAAAFSYCERARARELFEKFGLSEQAAEAIALPSATIVEYLALPDRLVLFVLTPSGVRTIQRNVARATLQRDVEQFQDTVLAGRDSDLRAAGRELYEILLSPVENAVSPSQPLVVVPDETLAMLPFVALVDGTGHFVIENRAVIVAPSVAVFRHLRTRAPSAGKPLNVLVVEGPVRREGDFAALSESRTEARTIASLYPSSKQIQPRGDPAKQLQEYANSADVIHFVGHALQPDDTNEAALVTSQNDDLESQLQVREIAALRLDATRVVVLAACGTARSYGRAGNTSVSLARSFIAAGAPSVIATLWPIDDGPAAEFFPRVHHHLARGASPAEAVRAVQIEWMNRQAPPRVWAAVQVIGS